VARYGKFTKEAKTSSIAMKQGQLCGYALMMLLAGSEMGARAQIFDPTNAVPLTNGTLNVDLKSL
jgi:hypothetical protein